MKRKKRAILYMRINSRTQPDSPNSLAAQEKALRAYCQEKEIEIIKIFRDDDPANPDLEYLTRWELIDYVNESKKAIDYLLVTRLDRLGHDTSRVLPIVQDLLRKSIDIVSMEPMHSVREIAYILLDF